MVKLPIRPAPPTGPGPATTSGQVAAKARSQSQRGSHPRSPTHSPPPSGCEGDPHSLNAASRPSMYEVREGVGRRCHAPPACLGHSRRRVRGVSNFGDTRLPMAATSGQPASPAASKTTRAARTTGSGEARRPAHGRPPRRAHGWSSLNADAYPTTTAHQWVPCAPAGVARHAPRALPGTPGRRQPRTCSEQA